MIIAEFASKNDLPLYIPKSKTHKNYKTYIAAYRILKLNMYKLRIILRIKITYLNQFVLVIGSLLSILPEKLNTLNLISISYLIIILELKHKVDNIITIPGVGKTTVIAILAESPDIGYFSSARDLAAYAGLTPKHRTSGTSLKGKTSISKIGSSNLRKALYFPTIVAKNHNPIFKKFTQKLSSKGKPVKVIIVAIMRKLLHIVFGVIKKNAQFNPHLILDS